MQCNTLQYNTNYLLTESEVFMGKSRPRPCLIDQANARSIRQGRGLRFSRKNRTFEFNKLFIIWLSALWSARGQYGRKRPYNWPIRACVMSSTRTSHAIHRGCYMPARGFEFYLQVFNSVSHSFAALTREILSWTREYQIHIHKRACNVLLII